MKKIVITGILIFLVVMIALGIFGFKVLQTKKENLLWLLQKIIPKKEGTALGLGDLCSNQQDCQAFCQANSTECERYCKENPSNLLCQKIQGKMGYIEGICSSKEECENFCMQNPSYPACNISREGEEGMKQGMETPILSIPFNKDDWVAGSMSFWPFCVHGGGHPLGHPGFDFGLKKDSKVIASSDGVVIRKEKPLGEEKEGVFEIMVDLGNGFVVDYSGLVNVQVNVNDKVSKRQFLGNPSYEAQQYSFHFGLNNYNKEKMVCPYDFLDSEFKSEVDTMIKKTTYPEQSKEPLICNCQEIEYEQAVKRGP